MADAPHIQVCRYCGFSGVGKYCGGCGQPYELKRISLKGLLHDVFHVFTHLDKGFAYTLKQLLIAPGKMQKAYIEGDRASHQKPFAMFLICATVAALTRYWIYQVLLKYYDAGSNSEIYFFHEYMVLLHIILLPLYALISYLFFYHSKYNYAEVGVLILYSISFFLVIATCISFLKLIWPALDTAYIELPILVIYNAVTFVNFFDSSPRWLVVLKSIIVVILIFLVVQVVEDIIIKIISKS
jgi:hypothetical protein